MARNWWGALQFGKCRSDGGRRWISMLGRTDTWCSWADLQPSSSSGDPDRHSKGMQILGYCSFWALLLARNRHWGMEPQLWARKSGSNASNAHHKEQWIGPKALYLWSSRWSYLLHSGPVSFSSASLSIFASLVWFVAQIAISFYGW